MRPFNLMLLASLNRGKEEEFRALLEKHNLHLGSIEDYVRNASFLKQVESHEREASYRENAFRKCRAVFQAAKVPCFADDSGLEIDALNGEPGVHSSHFGKPTARESQDQANRRKVLEALKGKSNRKARMRCVLVLIVEGLEIIAEGVCEGQIADKEVGAGGFGYDSIFLPDGCGGKSFAELSAEEKNNISHRAKAVAALVEKMQDRDLQLVRP